MKESNHFQTTTIAGEKEKATEKPPTLQTIFDEYSTRVFNLARRLLGNDVDAEDVTQDVFVQMARKLDTFRGECAFSTWLFRVTVNAALAHRRKRALQERHRTSDPLESFQDDGDHRVPVRRWIVEPQQMALDHEVHHLIENAIAAMPECYRDVYVLADVEELPNAEVAHLLGLSVPAIKSRLHRARVLMRRALAPYFEEKAA